MSDWYASTRPVVCLVAGALCATLMAGCCSGPDNLGLQKEQDGLSASIERIDPKGGEADLLYGLEWTSPAPAWALDGIVAVVPRFWDDDGNPIPTPLDPPHIILDDAFLKLDTKKLTTKVTVAVPPDTCRLSLALGGSGLETPRVLVP